MSMCFGPGAYDYRGVLKQQSSILSGRSGRVRSTSKIKELPDNFFQWMKNNKERLEAAAMRGRHPYYIKMNKISTIE